MDGAGHGWQRGRVGGGVLAVSASDRALAEHGAAYAHDLKLFWDFLAGRELSWDAVEVADLGDFVAWLRRPAPNVVPLPGVKPARSSATTNRALTAVMGFYEFHARHGVPVAARL